MYILMFSFCFFKLHPFVSFQPVGTSRFGSFQKENKKGIFYSVFNHIVSIVLLLAGFFTLLCRIGSTAEVMGGLKHF